MLKEPQLSDDAPWKRRFRASKVFWTQVAKEAPARGLAASNRSGAIQLYAWKVDTGELVQITRRAEGVGAGLISPDGRYVYYLHDKQGDERGHFARVPFEGGEREDITPDLPLYTAWGFALSRDSNLAGFTLADREGYHLYCVDLDGGSTVGSPRSIYSSPQVAMGPTLSWDGMLAVMGSSERAEQPLFSLLAFDTASGEEIAELWDGPGTSIRAVTFAPLPRDPRLLAATTRSGVKRPLIWNPLDGARIDLDLPELEGDVTPLDWSLDGSRILLSQFNRAVQRLHLYDLEHGAVLEIAQPGGSFWASYFGPDGDIWTQWEDSTTAPRLIALSAEPRIILASEEVPTGQPLRSITFPSSDGQEIQGWLGVPEGAGPFPAILETHGGPDAVATESFSPGAQAWIDHGFAYLSINYRGSTTFGSHFEQQIWGNLGHWEVEDMVAARRWLVESGIADPEKVLVTGWSYGGYLTLLALGKRPELWAGGMAGIAVADWAVQYEDSAETLKGYIVSIFGATPDEAPERYAASSPITYVDRVNAPVLVIQGRNDTRCPPRPVEMYEARMKALGKPIEVRWFEAGHGSMVIEQSIEHQEEMLTFAYRILSNESFTPPRGES